MKEKYGEDNIKVSCLSELRSKTIAVPERTLIVIDEADAAFIDLSFKIHDINNKGYLLGLTATGLSKMENYELNVIHNELRMLALSSGI